MNKTDIMKILADYPPHRMKDFRKGLNDNYYSRSLYTDELIYDVTGYNSGNVKPSDPILEPIREAVREMLAIYKVKGETI